MTAMKIKIKEEPPDEDLSAILDNGILLSSVDKEAEGLITQQIEEILPNDEDDEEEEDEDEEEEQEKRTPKRRLPCRYCDFKAKTKKELGRHEARHAIKGWYHECRYCDYVTYIRQRLQEHESKHTNTKPFKCEKCEFKTRFKADLYKHRAKHSTVKKFSCPQCDFRTKWCRNIKHHLLKHTEERPHSCEICGFKFKRIQDLKYHLYRHNDVKPIQCELCEFRCKTNYELKCHRLKHSNVKKFSCTFPGCTQKTKTKSDLTKHIRTHNKDNSYLCSMCGKGFNTMTSLNKHKDRHSNIRKFKCGLCEKWFKNKPSLRAHMKIHSGIKPFQCDVCLRYFLNKYNMHKHKETHTGDRPYLCPICPYGARISDHLLAHIGSMHGDSHAYFCELCRKPFKRYSQLQVHIKRMHKHVQNFDRNEDGKLDIKLESGADGVISTGNDVFSVKKIGDCHFEPEVKRKRGRPPKNKPPVPVAPPPETRGENSDPQLLKPAKIKEELTSGGSVIKLATFQDGFRLPLATKGFQFNFDKTGKKPRSWFMQPENMHGKAALKQRAYMAKKERLFDRLNSGRIQRVRKKSDVMYNGLNMMTRATAQKVCGTIGSDAQVSLLEKESEPRRLLISGRTKLKTMRKIKRRIRNIKASLKGSPLLDDPVQTQMEDGDVRSEKGDGNGVEGNRKIIKSEDEDDVPLSQLRAREVSQRQHELTKAISSLPRPESDSVNESSCSNNVSQIPFESCPKNSKDLGSENGHIKLVLKRRKEGTFKVTLNTSAHVPNPSPPAQNGTTGNKISNLASDVYNGSVRILGKSLQAKLNHSPVKSNRIKTSLKRKGGPKMTKSVIQKKKPKKTVVNHRSQKEKPLKENNCLSANKKKRVQKASKVVKGKQKETKSKKKDVTQSRSPPKTMKSKMKNVQDKSTASTRGKTKSKHTKSKSAQTKPKSKKKNLICSIGSSKSSNKKAQNISVKCSRNRIFLQNETVEEFPIKIEPVDDEYESSLKSPMSGAFMDDLSLVKSESLGEIVNHLPNCPGSSICSCATSIIKKEYTGEWEPQCRYLYDVKVDVNVDQSYNEHAIAWGLNLDSQGENENRDRSENLELKMPSPYCTGKENAQKTFLSGVDGSDVVSQHRSDLKPRDVEGRTGGETGSMKSMYCWGTSNLETNSNSVLPHAATGLLESYPLDLSLNRKFELCDEESADKGLNDSSFTQDKADDEESLLQCPISYTYTF